MNERASIHSSSVIRYEIDIVTGSMFDAGTSSPVWFTMHGTRGSIINKYLEIAEEEDFPFEPENSDRFVIYDLDIGEVIMFDLHRLDPRENESLDR